MSIYYIIFTSTFILFFNISTSFAQKLQTVYFKSLDGTKIKAYMMKPKRRGRFGAIVALHGCSGAKKSNGALTERHADWGKRFVRWGYVVLFPDSFGSRGVGSTCKTKSSPVRFSQRKQDAQGAFRWLAKRRYVRRNNISLLGWSHGAGTVIRLAYSKDGRKFKRAFAFYPDCRTMSSRKKLKRSIPITILAGQKDDWTPSRPCRTLVQRWGGKVIAYRGAYHGFDMPNYPVRTVLWVYNSLRGDGIVHVGTNERARNMSIDYISRELKGG